MMTNNYFRVTAYLGNTPDVVIPFDDRDPIAVRAAVDRAFAAHEALGANSGAVWVVWRRATGVPAHIAEIGEVSRFIRTPVYPVYAH
jgi:hypothetical protein